MNRKNSVSNQTRNNWIIMLLQVAGGLLVVFSSIYFLFLPEGGYQGGRNPYYGVEIIFSRSTWELIHTWSGVFIIATAAIHIPLHWSWIKSMTLRVFRVITGRCNHMSTMGQFNLLINGLIGVSGLIVAISGMYFLLVPGASHSSGLADPMWLFTRVTWDLIHTWSGVIAIAAAVLHFAIHWRWALKVTTKIMTNAVSGSSIPVTASH